MAFQDTGNNYAKNVICKAQSDPALPPKWETIDKQNFLYCMVPCKSNAECDKYANTYCARQGYCIPPCDPPENAIVSSSNPKGVNYSEQANIVGTITCQKGFVLAHINALTPDCNSVQVACKFNRQDGTLWRPWVGDGKIHPPAQCKRGIRKIIL